LVGWLDLWSVGRRTCLRLPDEVGKEARTKCSTLSVQSLQMGKHNFPLHLKVNLPFKSSCILFPIFHHFELRICIILISFPLAQLPPPLPLPPKAGGTCPPPLHNPKATEMSGTACFSQRESGILLSLLLHDDTLGHPWGRH
jgi:hypothetical protein